MLVDAKKQKIVDHFQAFVKPTINPKLSEFCIKLTGITQVSIFFFHITFIVTNTNQIFKCTFQLFIDMY